MAKRIGEKRHFYEGKRPLNTSANIEDSILSQLRRKVWEMRAPEDIETIAEFLRDSLDQLGIAFWDYGINVIDEAAKLAVLQIVHNRCPDGSGWKIRSRRQCGANIMAMWRAGKVYYRPDLEAEDRVGEKDAIEMGVQHAVRCVLDVPFSHGTLALNSDRPHAFTPQDIEFLIRVTQVISEGFRRTEDLRQLQVANEQLLEKERLLAAFQRIGESVLSSLDREEILDVLSTEIVEAGIFRSLMIALVEKGQVEVVRSFFVDANGKKRHTDNRIGMRYDLNDANITAEVARKGVFEVIEGWDERFDRSLATPDDYNGKVAYFLPIKKGENVLAVLATGSYQLDKDKILQRIDAMQPLLNQAAIALEHARLYGEREEQARQLVHLERLRAVGEMAAGISHNLNNILVGILGPAQVLREELPLGDWREQVGGIATAAERAADLVRRLNESVRGLQEQVVAVGIEPIVRVAVQNTRPRWKDAAEAQGYSIKMDLRPLSLPSVRASESGLYNVVVNLIFNAVDAMPDGGVLTIAGEREGNEVKLIISDTGKGMDEETRRRVFEPFFTTKADVGTGLGLATVYGTLQNWDGRIDVESAVGEGSVFTLYLPVWEGEAVEPADLAELVEEEESQGGRVLLVDDDEMVLTVLERMLRKDYRVTVCHSAGEVLELVARESFDVALIDWGMPDMPGDVLANTVRSRNADMALVLMSGWSVGEQGMPTPAFDLFLPKPFGRLAQVRETVAKGVVLSRRRSGQMG